MTPRQIAHITIEAATPLKAGGNKTDLMLDSPVLRDWNGLPMIFGTSIAGVLREAFRKTGNNDDIIFGYQAKERGEGSKVIFSNALLVDEEGKVCETLLREKSSFQKLFDTLPIREHVAITDKGVAKEHSKFDEEVVYKGTRFKFAIEMLDDQEAFDRLISFISLPAFRLGGGGTKGFGKFKILSIESTVIDTPKALENYSSSLNATIGTQISAQEIVDERYNRYVVQIKPDDFFMFGSGFGDEDADKIPVKEKVVDYEKNSLSEAMILMPASSLKGAIAHRTTYYYNLQNKHFVGDEEARGSISELFGEANQSSEALGSKGKVLFSDLYQIDQKEYKTFDHVAIDRFTGGALEGALFQEKTVAQDDTWEIEILVQKGIEEPYIKAFEAALGDLCSGMLSLGGAVTKGHGIFSGIWSKS